LNIQLKNKGQWKELLKSVANKPSCGSLKGLSKSSAILMRIHDKISWSRILGYWS
jgi:hypothetical protein